MKDWVDDLRRHVDEWSQRLARRNLDWWPKNVYHFTDVRNAVSILNSGILYSRARAERLGVMHVDNARPSVIVKTPADHLKYVRLYFRPVTPTQYNNEGIFVRRYHRDGHCPVPVFFLFDLPSLIGRDDAYFSKGTMAMQGYDPSSRRDYFREMEFDKVYHTGTFSRTQRDAIVQARHAEVVIPDELVLGVELRAIICRTAAERQTLLHGLDFEPYTKWYNRIRVNSRSQLFESGPRGDARRHYIETVDGFDDGKIRVELFNPALEELDIEIYFRADDGQEYGDSQKFPSGVKSMTYQLPREHRIGLLRYTIEGCLAYEGKLILNDSPF